MDSRYAVRDLTTAPRLGAYGLTRWRLPTAVELEITLNSQYTNTSPMVRIPVNVTHDSGNVTDVPANVTEGWCCAI